MNFRKRIDATDGLWHFSQKCQLWPQNDYRESNEPPSLAFERLCAECLKLEPGVSEEEIRRSIRGNAEGRIIRTLKSQGF